MDPRQIEILTEFAEFVKRRYDLHASDVSGSRPVDPDAESLAKTFLHESKQNLEQEERESA